MLLHLEVRLHSLSFSTATRLIIIAFGRKYNLKQQLCQVYPGEGRRGYIPSEQSSGLLLMGRIAILALNKELNVRLSDVIANIPEYPFAQIGRITQAVEERDAQGNLFKQIG